IVFSSTFCEFGSYVKAPNGRISLELFARMVPTTHPGNTFSAIARSTRTLISSGIGVGFFDLFGEVGIPHGTGGGHHRIGSGSAIFLVVLCGQNAADAFDGEFEAALFADSVKAAHEIKSRPFDACTTHPASQASRRSGKCLFPLPVPDLSLLRIDARDAVGVLVRYFCKTL